MPYLQVDLDALDDFQAVAVAGGISEGDVSLGCLKMWRYCWKNKVAFVSKERLEGFFPGEPERVRRALVTCEFIDLPPNRPDIHVRGSEKRLGIAEARSRGGKKARSNLRQFARKTPAEQQKTPAQAGDQPVVEPEGSTGSAPGLTSNIQHPASNKKPPAPKNPAPGWKEFVAKAFAVYREHEGCDPDPGIEDFAALKAMRKKHGEEETLIRIDRGLRGQFARQAKRWRDVRSKWDLLANDEPSNVSPIRTIRTDTKDSDFEREMAEYKTNANGDLLF